MSLFDKLNQIAKPFKRFVLNSPVHNLFSQKAAVVSFTEKQTGEKITVTVDYIREKAVVYLFFDPADNRWKDLVKGSPVSMVIEGVNYSGWAEDLTGLEEFSKILADNSAARSGLENRYGSFGTEDMLQSSGFKNIIDRNKLIRVKISH